MWKSSKQGWAWSGRQLYMCLVVLGIHFISQPFSQPVFLTSCWTVFKTLVKLGMKNSTPHTSLTLHLPHPYPPDTAVPQALKCLKPQKSWRSVFEQYCSLQGTPFPSHRRDQFSLVRHRKPLERLYPHGNLIAIYWYLASAQHHIEKSSSLSVRRMADQPVLFSFPLQFIPYASSLPSKPWYLSCGRNSLAWLLKKCTSSREVWIPSPYSFPCNRNFCRRSAGFIAKPRTSILQVLLVSRTDLFTESQMSQKCYSIKQHCSAEYGCPRSTCYPFGWERGHLVFTINKQGVWGSRAPFLHGQWRDGHMKGHGPLLAP